MGRDIFDGHISRICPVSIHTPVWGATKYNYARCWVCKVSIHAPVWGATRCPAYRRAGSGVSIHAPVWGATVRQAVLHRTLLFQSTRPYGARLVAINDFEVFLCFNPRARMGRDPWPTRLFSASYGFNPRARMGRDLTICSDINSAVFQSTRPYGARPTAIQISPLVITVSIHAPVWGATVLSERISISDQFQSTRPYGARLAPPITEPLQWEFQSTRPYGARLTTGTTHPVSSSFNPRARMGRDLFSYL